MRKSLLKGFLLSGLIMLLGASAVHAQTNLSGKYIYEDKTAEGNAMNSSFEFKGKKAVVFTYVSVADDYETETRPGIWIWNAKKKLLTITLPAVKENQVKGDDLEQIYEFKVVGKNLNLVKSIEFEDSLVGDVYKKL